VLHWWTTLYEIISAALMYFLCVVLIISIVHLCGMWLYKIRNSNAKNFRIFSFNLSFFSTNTVQSNWNRPINRTCHRKKFYSDEFQKLNYGLILDKYHGIIKSVRNGFLSRNQFWIRLTLVAAGSWLIIGRPLVPSGPEHVKCWSLQHSVWVGL
jgi:hypothetical protein